MNFIAIANRHARDRAEADPTVACLLVYPEERLDLEDLIKDHGGLDILHIQPGIDEGSLFYIRCQGEWKVEGLERAWASFRRFRRMLPPRGGRRGT